MLGRGAGAWSRLVGSVAAALALLGCSATAPSPSAPTDEPAAEPTPLAAYDTTAVAVARGPFCDRVSPTGLEHALGAAAEASEEHGNGDRVVLPDGLRDIVHEYGCRWEAADGTAAAAWVFAPPVTRQRGQRLADTAVAAAEETGARCRPLAGAADLGSPGAAVSCADDGDTLMRYVGLVGDAWLSCELSGPDVDRQRTEAWCAAVVEAARA